jgi:uncharacterized protein YggE
MFAALLILSASILFGQSVQPCKENSLVVNGTAILKQTPEMMTASISVNVKADKYIDCQDKLVKAIAQVTSLLIKNGIEKEYIRTNDLNVSEQRDYLPNNTFKLNFEGNSVLFVEHLYTTDFARKLLAALQNESVSLHYSLNFSLSENQKEILRKKAIETAIADAKSKAEVIAAASGVRLLKINSITFTDNEMGRFYESDLVQENRLYAGDIAMSKAGSPSPEIDFNPKELGIKKSIVVEWLIEEKK